MSAIKIPPQPSVLRLANKVALVTGSSRGMGQHIALTLASHGASVVVTYASSQTAALSTVSAIKSLPHAPDAIALQFDAASPSSIASLFKQAVAHFGKLDIIVSNSGVEHFGDPTSVTPDEFDNTFNINTRGQFFVAAEGYKHITPGGKIVLFSSISAKMGSVPHHAVYAGSKAAVEAFTRCLARDFGSKKVNVNCVAPGGVKTDMYAEVARRYIPHGEGMSDEQVDEHVKEFSPLGRVAVPDDVSKVVSFLCSDEAGWINGQVVDVNGGAM